MSSQNHSKPFRAQQPVFVVALDDAQLESLSFLSLLDSSHSSGVLGGSWVGINTAISRITLIITYFGRLKTHI